MKKDIFIKLHASFEELVQNDAETGGEYWLARDLQELLASEVGELCQGHRESQDLVQGFGVRRGRPFS